MANEEHLAILWQGIDIWNKWRVENPQEVVNLNWAKLRNIQLDGAYLDNADLSRADLTRANLRNAKISGADLRDANLRETDFQDANLQGANLCEANLNEANLSRTNLRGVDLSKTDLTGANLEYANLFRADLNRADLSKANLSGADLRGTNLNKVNLFEVNLNNVKLFFTSFCDVDLRATIGLENVQHLGYSYIDISTVYRSKGEIPESFMRGAGVPDVFIEYMGSLVGKAIEYYSCFISYSSKDQAIAERLHADLQNNGVRCWYAPHDLRIGERYWEGIDEAIRFHDKLLLILSEDSVGSGWVEREVETALEKERSQGQLGLFPVRIDDAVFEINSGWAAHIREKRHIGDFREWKNHDAYRDVFQRLLRDLKTDEKAPTPTPVFTTPNDPENEKLIAFIDDHFNEMELKDLYAYVTVEYDAVPGGTKAEKARELVAYFDRHRPGGAAMLSDYLRAKRPNLLDR